jgi:hypothetical protein
MPAVANATMSLAFSSCRVVTHSVTSFSGLTRGLGKKMIGYGWNGSMGLLMHRILYLCSNAVKNMRVFKCLWVYRYSMRGPHLGV